MQIIQKLKNLSQLQKGSLIAIALLIFGLLISNLFNTVNGWENGIIIIVALITVLFTLFNVHLEGYKLWIKNLSLLLIIGFFSYLLFEIFDGSELTTLTLYSFSHFADDSDFKMRTIINISLCMFPCFILFMFSASARFSLIAGIILEYIIGLVFYFTMMIRGDMVLFTDLYSLSTAMDVVSNYHFSITPTLISGSILTGVLIVLALQAEHMSSDKWARRRQRLITSATLCIAIVAFVNVNIEDYYYSWKMDWNGHPYVFALNAKLTRSTPPSDYDANALDTLIPEDSDSKDTATEKPNIIVVMNESFADLNCLGDLETNVDYMPNVHNLTENTIRGQAYVSVFGGGTCDSEYAFLSGNTVAFLADNARPYQLYVNDTSPSLVSTLNDLGYSSHALHPGEASAWNRDNVYPDLGFEDFTSKADMESDSTYTRDAYISDADNYRYLINSFEENEANTDQPYFALDVTIENHGGYEMDASGLDSVEITNLEGDYPRAEQYMSVVKDSDAAFGDLIDYFTSVDEKTIIVMFGDHLPYLESDFFTETIGKQKSDYTLEDAQKRQNTPFLLWANYDIEEQDNVSLSLNYLSSFMLEEADLPLTAYNKYLLNLSEKMPVINKKGVITDTGSYYSLDDPANPYYNDLVDYQEILYNNIFDDDNRANDKFYLQ